MVILSFTSVDGINLSFFLLIVILVYHVINFYCLSPSKGNVFCCFHTRTPSDVCNQFVSKNHPSVVTADGLNGAEHCPRGHRPLQPLKVKIGLSLSAGNLWRRKTFGHCSLPCCSKLLLLLPSQPAAARPSTQAVTS